MERKFGGKRRQIAIYLDELEWFQQIRLGNARDLEQYADLLDVAIINLQEAGQFQKSEQGNFTSTCRENFQKACWRTSTVGYSKMAGQNQSFLYDPGLSKNQYFRQ